MKKILSLLGIVSAMSLSSGAATISYGYCGEPGLCFGVAWQEYTALVEFPQSFTETFDGGEIIGMQIASPDNFEDPEVNNFTSLNLGFYEEMGGVPFYTQPATLSSVAYEWNDIMLDSPIKIEAGKPFFVGYSGISPTIDDTCFAVDFQRNNDSVGLWLGWTDEDTGEEIWEPFTDSYGNLCLRLIISATHLPEDIMNLDEVYLPGYVRTGEPFSLTATVTNNAYNDIESFTLAYSVGEKSGAIDVAVTPPLQPGATADVDICGLVCEEVGVAVPLDYSVTAVNGNQEAVITDSSAHDALLLSLPEGVGYQRNVVIEEGTGTWCGYCPMGIVAMDYLAEKYTDGSLIPVAIHYNDPMESETYVEVAKEYFDAYPKAMINRDIYRYGVVEPDSLLLEALYLYTLDIPAYARLNINADYADESRTSLEVSAVATFAVPTANSYRLEIALTENNMGPYPQTNFFAGTPEEMGGFENMGDPVLLTYNEVGRAIYSCGKIEQGVEEAKDYDITASVSLDALSDKENFTLVAMLVNNETGEIENAVMKKFDGGAGIHTSMADSSNIRISISAGSLSISGAEGQCYIYTPSGTLIATIESSGSVSFAPGIYLVKTPSSLHKVYVR